MLDVQAISTSYGPINALNEISLTVGEGEVIAIVGANGVGKTTLLKSIAGLIKPEAGRIAYRGEDVTSLDSHRRITKGIVLVPEGRRLFPDLTVHENLRLGAFSWRRRARRGEIEAEIESVFALFPILKERSTQLARTLSGGQQQMVAIGRGLVSRPSLLLLDEPSLGLAPLVIRQIFRTLADLRTQRKLSIVLVEQDAQAAFRIADRGYVMQRARIVLTGSAADLRADPRTREIYFGSSV
ncbi:MAG: ABC transporter ATP-binding protein [Acidobacteriota bacterium]